MMPHREGVSSEQHSSAGVRCHPLVIISQHLDMPNLLTFLVNPEDKSQLVQ